MRLSGCRTVPRDIWDRRPETSSKDERKSVWNSDAYHGGICNAVLLGDSVSVACLDKLFALVLPLSRSSLSVCVSARAILKSLSRETKDRGTEREASGGVGGLWLN